jgi:hypothetical protein
MNTEDLTIKHDKLPLFVVFENLTYTFRPKLEEHLGQSIVRGYILNDYGSTEFTIQVQVLNDAPLLAMGPPKTEVLLLGSEPRVIELGDILDPDGDATQVRVQVLPKPLPPFLRYSAAFRNFTVDPKIVEVAGSHTVYVKLTDQFGGRRDYTFVIEFQTHTVFNAIKKS